MMREGKKTEVRMLRWNRWIRRSVVAAAAVATVLPFASPTGLARAQEKRPVAYVLDATENVGTESSAAKLLEAAGFRVERLPLDRSPLDLSDADLVFLASFASELPEYAAYMTERAAQLRELVSRGCVLVQMTQPDEIEPAPPFLPQGLTAQRHDADFPSAVILEPTHALVRGLCTANRTIRLDSKETILEGIVASEGLEVILASDDTARRGALLEGACGRGRILLCAMDFDRNPARGENAADAFEAARSAWQSGFFANLREYVASVRAGAAPPVLPTPSQEAMDRFTKGSWTLAVLPDTQNYAEAYPGLFLAQTAWIARNVQRLGIRYVFQLGDVTNRNSPLEWRRAREAMALLDGVVPYAIAPGNHDYGPGGGATTRETGLNEQFPPASMAAWPTFGGTMEEGRLDNSFHLFEAGGRSWIVLALEWGPRDEVLEWADGVMQNHRGRAGILLTHAFLNHDDRRLDASDKTHPQKYNPHDYPTPGARNDGEEIWQKLVRRHDFVLVLSGHILDDGTGYLASRTDRGGICHQILANYQMRSLGGEAYLRLLEFLPDGATVVVRSYSPLYDRYLAAPDQQFRFRLE